MNGSRNESTARKMARGKTQTAAEWRACMNFHWKFIWFGKICGSIPLELQKSSPSSKKATQNAFCCWKTFIYDGLGRASWESRGIDRAESTVRKMARKDQISLQSVLSFQENGPWEHRFCLRVASFWNFQQQKRLRVASFWRQNAWEWYRFWTWGINFT